MEFNDKFVEFDKYCKSCANFDKKDSEEPCNECLSNPVNTNSKKPINYEKKESINEEKKKKNKRGK